MKKNYLLVLMLAFGLSSLQAGIIYVKPSGNGSGDSWSSAASLTDALNWAEAGDEIFVAKGTYTGSFKCLADVKVYGNCEGHETTTPPVVTSAENLETFLVGTSDKRVLYIEGKPSLWIGFDISGGDASLETTGVGRGGGVYINQGGATLKYCRIHDNIAIDGNRKIEEFNAAEVPLPIKGYGGGVYAWQGNLENCIIENNVGAANPYQTARGWSMAIGGGICLDATEGSTFDIEKAVVLNCIIRNNSTTPGEDNASYQSQGGGIAIKSGKLVNSLLVGNRVNGSNNNQNIGGGVAFVDKGAEVINCTVVGNHVQGLGGGIALQTQNASPTAGVYNCIAWGNSARTDSYGEGQQDIRTLSVKEETFTVGVICAPASLLAPFDAVSVITGDPKFTNPDEGDYTLQAGSPAIDAGDEPPVAGYSVDLAGNSRIAGDAVDLGAYEYGAGEGSAIENTMEDNGKIIKTQYYTMLGYEISQPAVSGVYIVKNTYESQKVITSKVYITVK